MNDEGFPRKGDDVPQGEGLEAMLEKAWEEGVIVVFGGKDMTVEEIMHAMMHPHHAKGRVMIIGDAPRSVPGDASALN